ncbi:hypothetical protein QBC39DRAFT_403414, partial [Podospora conica]
QKQQNQTNFPHPLNPPLAQPPPLAQTLLVKPTARSITHTHPPTTAKMQTVFALFVAVIVAITPACAITISLPSGVSIPSGVTVPSGVVVQTAGATATTTTTVAAS